MAPQTSIPVAANVLGTIATVLWSIQLIPQVIYNWRRKKTDGLPGVMMFLWAICLSLASPEDHTWRWLIEAAVPFGVYDIVQVCSICTGIMSLADHRYRISIFPFRYSRKYFRRFRWSAGSRYSSTTSMLWLSSSVYSSTNFHQRMANVDSFSAGLWRCGALWWRRNASDPDASCRPSGRCRELHLLISVRDRMRGVSAGLWL